MNPYRPTQNVAEERQLRGSWILFVASTVAGLNLYFVYDRGPSWVIHQMMDDPIDLLGPAAVFALLSIPFAAISAAFPAPKLSFLARRLPSIIGGLALGIIPLHIDHYLRQLAAVLSIRTGGLASMWVFVSAFAASGIVATGIQLGLAYCGRKRPWARSQASRNRQR